MFIDGYRDWGHPFTVTCINAKTNEREWECLIWGAGRNGPFSGVGSGHRVSLARLGDQLLVFGVEMKAVFVEAVRIPTGRVDYRFCTSYGYGFSESWRF